RYAFLFQLDPTDYKSWATGLRKAGYATNYRYAQILVKLIEDYKLEQYTLIAMGQLSLSTEALAANAPGGNTSSIVVQATNPGATYITIPRPIAVNRIIMPVPAVIYPPGEFNINRTRVVFAKEGTALLSVAEQYHLSFAHLLDFNDLDDGDILKAGQLLFLQRKRKSGDVEFHSVQDGETLYGICQSEGIRLESLLAYNILTAGMQPATGEKLYLQAKASARPLLAEEKTVVLKEVFTGIVPAPVPMPDSTTHIVQTRETLYSISRKYGVSLDQLKTWNKLDSLDLRIGQQLLIYSK
ncbi:MAG: LysM peptidoglycan-binding domain-containing protein, partial [Bacteroidota bacterium]